MKLILYVLTKNVFEIRKIKTLVLKENGWYKIVIEVQEILKKKPWNNLLVKFTKDGSYNRYIIFTPLA